LVKKGSESAVKEKFTKLYADQFNIELKIYDVKVSNGTSLYKN
jgi:galactokinase